MKRFSLIFLLVLAATGAAFGAAPKPAEKLSGTVDEALEIVYGECCGQDSIGEKQAKVLALIESKYDMTVLIRRAIGRNWNLMNAEEQTQVLGLVKQLVAKAYVSGLDGKSRPDVSFEDTIQVSAKRIEIPSVVVLDGTAVRVLYRMGLMGSDWELFDIVAEDISVVSNYRQQFDDHFRRGNGAELIAKLQDLLQNENLDETIKI
jgi:phospholipid transport system substrate-binding protein